MKILSTISYYHPYISGLSLYCQYLSEGLAKKGFEVAILTGQYRREWPLVEKNNGVTINRVPHLLKISKGFLSPFWILYSLREIRKTEVVILHLPQFEAFISAFMAKILGKKVISVYHCEVVLPKSLVNFMIETLLHLANFLALLLSDKVITYTKDYGLATSQLALFRSKLLYCYPPIKLNKKIRRRQMPKISSSFSKIGFAGRIASEKGIEYLLEALPKIEKKVGKVKLLIAGLKPVGEDHYNKKIFKLTSKNKEKIIFLGKLMPDEMPLFYKMIDVLVLPSLNLTESFGFVQVEAMYEGVPVVASNLPGVRVPIKLTQMGEIAPRADSRKLAEQIIKVLLNKEKYQVSKEKIEKIFDINKTIDFFEKIFNSN